MDIKSIVRFNDSEFRTYAQSVGTPNRYNLSMNREDAAELDAIAKALDMDRGRLIRELLKIGAAMFSINPQPFIDESKRCHHMLAQSLIQMIEAFKTFDADAEATRATAIKARRKRHRQ